MTDRQDREVGNQSNNCRSGTYNQIRANGL
jgi:hypothetical protein